MEGTLVQSTFNKINVRIFPTNYTQVEGSQVTINDGSTGTIISVNLTSTGRPVHLFVTGDINPLTAGGVARLQFFRDGTAIGGVVHCEPPAAGKNQSYALTYIDTPVNGPHTYTLNAIQVAGTNMQFGEVTGPVMSAMEF